MEPERAPVDRTVGAEGNPLYHPYFNSELNQYYFAKQQH